MPDPFEALRTAPTPIDPDPAFAARLQARVARALRPPEEGEPSMTLQTPETTNQLRQGDMSYLSLWVPDLDRAARFYTDVLGWHFPARQDWWARVVEGQSIAIGLSQFSGTAQYMRSVGVPLPQTLTPTGYVVFVVDDVAAAVERVRAAGGYGGDVKDQPYGRQAVCIDDQGLAFTLQQIVPMPRPPATGARNGDPAYVVFELPDGARARAFYEAVLGVRSEAGHAPDSWNLPDIAPMSAIIGGAARPAVVPMFRVDDIQTAVGKVRAAGGTASEPRHERYGTRAECVDDQGLRFNLGQL